MAEEKDRVWISVKDWKELEDKDAQNYCLHKDMLSSVVKADNADERTVKFVISKSTVDRDGDVIAHKGWDLDNFKKNPVVIFGHDYKSLPIAKALSIDTVRNQLVSVAEFATREVYPFADTVYQMIKGGFLNATSVGFKPLAYESNDKRGGYDFLKQELLEYSVVPIPAHPEALVEARAAGIDVAVLKDWAENILDSFDEIKEETKDVVTREELEQMFKDLKETLVQVPETKDPIPDVQPTESESNDVTPKEQPESETKEINMKYLDLMVQELILRGFQVKKNGEDVQKNEALLQDKDFSHFSDDQIFDFMIRQIGDSELTYEIKDEIFDYPLIQLENQQDQITEEQIMCPQKEASPTVEKLNPTVLDCLMPKSYEAIAAQLRSSCRNYLTGNGKSCDPEHEYPVLLATFQRSALFAVIGSGRGWDEDPTYEGTWRMNGRTGLAEWTNEPKEIDIQVSLNVVNAATQGKAADLKEEKNEQPEVKEGEKNPDVFLELDDETSQKDVEEVITAKLSDMSSTIAEAVRQGLRQAQGKLD